MTTGNRLNCTIRERGLWLVKVPKYLSELWVANEGSDVGVLKIIEDKAGVKVKVISDENLLLSTAQKNPDLVRSGPHLTQAPREHDLHVNDVQKQNITVIVEDKSGLHEDANIRSGKLVMQGRVVKRVDCRPNDDQYMKMKITQIQRHQQPKKSIRQLEKAEVKFKPISQHQEEQAKQKQKKEGAKLTRASEDVVRNALFHAFERHQYYKLSDLQQLTQQPAGYIKDILLQIADYNTAPPHKAMWELKPEYRNYSVKKGLNNEDDK